MARKKGDFDFSANFEVKKKATLDARQYVNNYSELLAFTSDDYIPYGFPVTCGGQDDFSKLGTWFCVNPNDLSNPLSWVKSNDPIPYNQVIQNGSFTFNNTTFKATVGVTTEWGFNEEGVQYLVGNTEVDYTAPDDTLPRYDLLVWDSVNGYAVIEGIPSNDPAEPDLPSGKIYVKPILRNVDGTTELPEVDLTPYLTKTDAKEQYVSKLNKVNASKGYTGGEIGIVNYPKGAIYGESYSNVSGIKTTGILRIKLPLSYYNVVMKIEGAILRQNPTELINFHIGGYWSGGYSDGAGGYRNWWSIDPATWDRGLSDLTDIPVRFGYELDNPTDPTSVKHAVIYIGETNTDWGSTVGFFIKEVYCLNSTYSVDNTKDFEINVIDTDDAIIYNQATVMVVPAQPISFVDKVLSGCELTFSDSDTKVSVGAGYYDIAGTSYNPPAMGTPFNIPAPDPSLPRRDIITGTQGLISSADSYYKYITGTPSESAIAPNVPTGEVLIRDILVSTAGTEPSEPDLSGYAKLSGGNTFTGAQKFKSGGVTVSSLRVLRFDGLGVTDELFNIQDAADNGQLRATMRTDNGGYAPVYSIDRESQIFDFKQTPTINGVPIGTGSGAVDSVNGQTGVVVLDADNIDDTSTTNKFVTSGDLTVLSNTSGTNTGDETASSIQSKRPLKTIEGQSLEGSGNIDLSKSDIGLANVDNTSDVNKPVSTAQQTALDLKADKNTPITGATKTKVTYDAKGLITSGADATTADINDSADRRYVTDAQKTYNDATSSIQTQIYSKQNTGHIDSGYLLGVMPALTDIT